jgi:CRISPR-associated protein Cst2
MTIKGILITLVAPMSDHIANGGEKILGNASSIKQRPDGRVYISGQKQRHALFSALDRLNLDDATHGETYISNGDGTTTLIEKDIRADLGGYLDTNKNQYSGRRTAPLTATPAVALVPSDISRDLLVRLKVNANDADSKGQALATREYSQHDDMRMSFHIDIGAVGIRRRCTYEKELHLKTEFVKHLTETERRRRIRLAIEATGQLTDYANNARNATSAEPQRVLIVFDTRLSRKASRYFVMNDIEQKNVLADLERRGATYFLGDDTTVEGFSVGEAYEKALATIDNSVLYDPAGGDSSIKTTEQFDKGQ